MGYLCNIKKLYMIRLFQSFIPAYVIERLFWQARGMNVQMVVYCEIIYSVTAVLFEIPSGILADRIGRKRLLVLDGLISAIEFILLLCADSFWMFGAAVFLSGIGKAFSSGSENALLYDSLLASGRQKDFEKLLGRISAVDFMGSLAAALSGSVLANYFELEFNYIISFFSMLAAFLVTLLLKEPPMVTKPESELTGFQTYAAQAVSIFRRTPLLLLYCITGAVLGACLNYLDEFWQLILEDIGIPVIFFGVVSSIVFVLRIPGNLLAYKLKDRFRYKDILNLILIISAAGYAAIFMTRNVLCLIPMLLVSLSSGITEPLIMGYVHHHTESHIRATVESFYSLGLRVITILAGLIFGYISTEFSIFPGFGALGLLCLAYIIIFRILDSALGT